MSDIGTAVSYLVAVTELAVVRSVRNATRENLIEAGGVEGPLGTIRNPKRVDLTRRPDPDVGVAARPVVHVNAPGDACDAAQTVRVVELAPRVSAADGAFETTCDAHRHAAPAAGSKSGPLVPPWRMPIEPEGASGPPIIKCPPPPPDVIGKGQLLDFFM